MFQLAPHNNFLILSFLNFLLNTKNSTEHIRVLETQTSGCGYLQNPLLWQVKILYYDVLEGRSVLCGSRVLEHLKFQSNSRFQKLN